MWNHTILFKFNHTIWQTFCFFFPFGKKYPGRESVSKAHHSNNETDFQPGFVNNISEEVFSQLHSGITKATRKVLLDEIVSHTTVSLHAIIT